jgi:hypothetical protein
VRIAYVVSDQAENMSAVGITEENLAWPIGIKAAEESRDLGHEAQCFNPKKDHTLFAAKAYNADVMIFVHVNDNGTTKKEGVMIVMDSRKNEVAWGRAFGSFVANRWPFGYWGVSNDYAMRSFHYWFYNRIQNYPKIKRLVIEMGNMKNKEQAAWLRDHPTAMGGLIADAVDNTVAHEEEGLSMADAETIMAKLDEMQDDINKSQVARSHDLDIIMAKLLGGDVDAAIQAALAAGVDLPWGVVNPL